MKNKSLNGALLCATLIAFSCQSLSAMSFFRRSLCWCGGEQTKDSCIKELQKSAFTGVLLKSPSAVKNAISRAKNYGYINEILFTKFGEKADTLLIKACKIGDRKIAQAIIKEASHGDRQRFCDLLLAKDCNGVTPILAACESEQPEILEMLLRAAGSDNELLAKMLTSYDITRRTPLFSACCSKSAKLIKIIMNAVGNKVDILQNILTVTSFSGETPFTISCTKGSAKIVKLLLSSVRNRGSLMGLILSSQNGSKFRYNPLFLACKKGDMGIVKILLKAARQENHIANVISEKNDKGMTAFDVAKNNGFYRIAWTLSNEANPTIFKSVVLGINNVFAVTAYSVSIAAKVVTSLFNGIGAVFNLFAMKASL